MEERKTVKVVAAIIRRGDKIFATQRGYGEFKDGWEFPGGKVEVGETPQEALAREIREELSADIIVGDLLTTVEYDYPKFHLSMDCFWAELAERSEMTLLEHEAAKWLGMDELDTVNWLPADIEVVKAIQDEKKRLSQDNTQNYYNEKSNEFFESTVSADVSSLYDHFLKYIPEGGHILDFGCGSGRDTKAFMNLGYDVEAIDGSPELSKLASEYTGINVKCRDFFDLNETAKYDAIWACASIIHVHSEKLPLLLSKMRDAVCEKGIIYASFKKGEFEGERNGRYFVDMTAERFRNVLGNVDGLSIVEEWYSEDVREDRDNSWYDVILRKG